jgi:hypothetical protein
LLEGVSIAPLDLVQHRLDVKSTTHLSVPTHGLNWRPLHSPACENLLPLRMLKFKIREIVSLIVMECQQM